jgi:drug/metabolite transporter (DMT)-like permease
MTNHSILFALGSLLSAGVSDVVYKFYARQLKGVGTYIAVIGSVWIVIFSVLAFPATLFKAPNVTLMWGLISGTFGATANIFFVEAMARSEAGVCSTIYRLNLALAALFAIIVMGEAATTWKWLGIVTAVGAVLLFYEPPPPDHPHHKPLGLWLAIAASLLRAGMGVTYKAGLSSGADGNLMLAVNGVVWLVAGLAYCVVVEKGHVRPTANTWGYGFLSGLLTTGIVLFLVLALKGGDVSIVLPITQLSFMVTCFFGLIFFHERMTTSKAIGVTLAIGCIMLMSVNR